MKSHNPLISDNYVYCNLILTLLPSGLRSARLGSSSRAELVHQDFQTIRARIKVVQARARRIFKKPSSIKPGSAQLGSSTSSNASHIHGSVLVYYFCYCFLLPSLYIYYAASHIFMEDSLLIILIIYHSASHGSSLSILMSLLHGITLCDCGPCDIQNINILKGNKGFVYQIFQFLLIQIKLRPSNPFVEELPLNSN